MLTPRHRYRVCGLSIASSAPILGLPSAPEGGVAELQVSMNGEAPPAGGPCHESIRYVSAELDVAGEPILTVWTRSSGGYRFAYSEGAQFLLSHDGRHVDVHWSAPLIGVDAVVYLLGPVLGFLMRLRGIVPLHASGVVVGSRSILFVGDGGAGKSTTAAVFASLGHPVLGDDLVPVVRAGSVVMACPSHPRLSVWPDSTEALFGSVDALPPVSPTYSKRCLDLAQHGYRFEDRPVPMEAIYLLGRRSARARGRNPVVRALPPRTALIALVRNTYCNYLLDASMRAREFDILTQLVERVPVREIVFSDSMGELPALCKGLVDGTLMEAAGQHT